MRADPISTPIALRAVRFEEVAQVLRLIRRAIDVGCRNHYHRRQLDAVYASYAGTLFVDTFGPVETIAATVGGRIVGVAQLDGNLDRNQGRNQGREDGRLRALFVDGDWQGRGLGRALMAEVEARAVRQGCLRLHGAMSLNAVPFYAAAGFHACPGPPRLVTTRTHVPVVRMEKELAR